MDGITILAVVIALLAAILFALFLIRQRIRKRQAAERARLEAEARRRKELEEQARLQAERRAREAEERTRLEAEKRAREAEERARRETEERLRQEARERARWETEARARLEAERRRQEADTLEQQREEQRREERLLGEPEKQISPVRFHTLWHRYMQPEQWRTLLIYIFSGSRGLEGARADFRRRISAPVDEYGDSSATSRQRIQIGTKITILPELSGFRFNPPNAMILWLEDWHVVEFRMQVLPEVNSQIGRRIEGRIAFFVGPLQIAENQLYVDVQDRPIEGEQKREDDKDRIESFQENGSTAYRSIFVSYSHQDSCIVDRLQKAYRALGDSYLRDIDILRSGEKWNDALLMKIQDADIFQLCWSRAAKQSEYVEREWRHALGLRRDRFIRPMYWERPLPLPPPELSDIHFTYVDMDA